jgi:hypothetical protein
MSPYSQIHYEYVTYILLGGVLLTALLWLAVWSRELTFTFRRRSEAEYQEKVHEFGDGIREGHRPVPLFLLVTLVLLIAWAVGYTIWSGDHYPY